MGLRERLEAARQQREGADEQATPATAPVGAAGATQHPPARWGLPGRCPQCSGKGYLDHLDLIDRIMYQHCKECGHRWQVSKSELAEA